MMKINEFNPNNYTTNSLDKKERPSEHLSQTKELNKEFDLSIIHQNHASTYNTQEAHMVLENINYTNEVKEFSKENILDRFSQPLTQAQANLSSQNVNRLLQA